MTEQFAYSAPIHTRASGRRIAARSMAALAILAVSRCARSDQRPVATCVLATLRAGKLGREASHAPHFDWRAVELLGPPEDFLLPRLLTLIEDHQVARVRAAPIHVARCLRQARFQ